VDFRDDNGATLIQVPEHARVQDKVTHRKAIAKIPPENTHHLVTVIKHNEGAGSQL
jgi:hypothetical protein